MDNFNKGIKLALFGLAGLLIVAALLFGGYRLGQEKEKSKEQKEEQKEQSKKSEEIQKQNEKAEVEREKPTPTPTILPIPTLTPDSTADWKTFTNTKYFYSFKYPNHYAPIQVSVEQYETSDEFFFSTPGITANETGANFNLILIVPAKQIYHI